MSQNGAPHRSSGRRSPAARPTDDELLDGARAVFSERGFALATMDAIAERANSTKPTLYAHFGDKAALYRAAFNREAAALRDWVISRYDESVDQAPMESRVRAHVMALFSYATAQPDGFRLLFQGLPADEMSATRQGVVELITGRVADQIRGYLVHQGRKAGPSVELLASMMVGLVGAAAQHTIVVDGLDPLAAGELATAFIGAAVRNLDVSVVDKVDREVEL